MLSYRHQGRILAFFGYLNGQNRVIEMLLRRHVTGYHAAFRVDQNIVRLHAYFMKHRTQKSSLILAVSKTVAEDVCRRVRLPTADAQPDSDVADIPLNKIGKRMHFFFLGLVRGGQLGNLLLDQGRSIAAPSRQIRIPKAHIPPSFESLCLRPATGRKQCNHHARGHALPGGHIRLKLDCGKVRHNPLVLVPSNRWRNVRMIDPYRAIFPTGRQL